MKFMKFGKALLIAALSAGVILGVTSCIQSYTVGFLYVTGTQTAQTNGAGVISGFKIDHNTGNLVPINGLPVSSGGANPGRAVLILSGRFLYVLNRGTNAEQGSTCTLSDPCTGANITQFAIGGNGVLSFQNTFYTQGINPFRLITDGSGKYLYALDQGAPSSASCALALGAGVTSCGDITAFTIDPTTGRLSLVVNAQVTSAGGAPLPYFPVPADPIDMLLVNSYIYTLSGTPSTGDAVFPYTQNPNNGQLTVNQNGSQPLGIMQGTALASAGGVLYVLDNEPPALNPNQSSSQLLPFQPGTNGALQAEPNGVVPDEPTESNPVVLLLEKGQGKWLYVANYGNNSDINNAQSGLAAYVVNTPFLITPLPNGGQATGTGAGPVCLLEDPSNQFVYTANFNDSTVTGHSVDQKSGWLRPLSQITKAKDSYPLPGPAAWCLVTPHTS